MTYQGRCHCGDVKYTIDGEIESVLECNCSYCERKGYLLWFVPRDALKLTSSPADMRTYTFNRHVIEHRFCGRCGCAPFGEATDPKGNATAAINVRCLEGVELSTLKVTPFDGRSK